MTKINKFPDTAPKTATVHLILHFWGAINQYLTFQAIYIYCILNRGVMVFVQNEFQETLVILILLTIRQSWDTGSIFSAKMALSRKNGLRQIVTSFPFTAPVIYLWSAYGKWYTRTELITSSLLFNHLKHTSCHTVTIPTRKCSFLLIIILILNDFRGQVKSNSSQSKTIG